MNQWQGVMKNHAKSFYLASLFFPRALWPQVRALYALCRWLDDAVDEAPNREQAILNLSTISEDLKSEKPLLPVNIMYRESSLDISYMEDLIKGAQDDLSSVRIENQRELMQYCYKVAGTVGLAMFDLMKISDPQARAHAVDLGLAMQITNICRDIKEDLERDRIYIPIDLLTKHGLDPQGLIHSSDRQGDLRPVVKELLWLADRYYASAQMAFTSIPWRTRGAIIIAAQLYRGIGLKLLKNGADPMQGRIYLNTCDKARVLLSAIFSWGLSAFQTQPKLNHDAKLHLGLEPWKQMRGFDL